MHTRDDCAVAYSKLMIVFHGIDGRSSEVLEKLVNWSNDAFVLNVEICIYVQWYDRGGREIAR